MTPFERRESSFEPLRIPFESLREINFERIMVKAQDSIAQPLSIYELEQYPNGKKLYEKRSRYW